MEENVQTMLEDVVSCLRNERIVVRHIPRESRMVGNNPKHVLFGGMAETSVKIYTVPQLRSGSLADPLTKDEKKFLEKYLGLKDNALSIYNKESNFWSNYQVRLSKDDNYLDLNNPEDYIKWKVLKLNTNSICPDLETLQEKPKATYEFVLISEGEQEKATMKRVNFRKEAYKEFGKIEDDAATMRLVVEAMTQRPFAKTTKKEALVDRLEPLIENDPKLFLKIVQDTHLKTKVLIREAIDAGAVVQRADQLYYNGQPLCDSGEATLSVAAAYLDKPKNQEIKFAIEAKIKANKDN